MPHDAQRSLTEPYGALRRPIEHHGAPRRPTEPHGCPAGFRRASARQRAGGLGARGSPNTFRAPPHAVAALLADAAFGAPKPGIPRPAAVASHAWLRAIAPRGDGA